MIKTMNTGQNMVENTEEDEIPRNKTKVLIVEDEKIVALDIKDMLIELGYEVTRAVASGEDAIIAAIETQPEIVIMDIKLPGEIDGIDAAVRIKELISVPILYLTAYSDNETLKRAKITIPQGYILKPFDERELQKSMEIALYNHKMEQKLKNSELKYKNLVENLNDGIFASKDGVLSSVNQSMANMFGTVPGKLINKPLWDLVSEKQTEEVKQLMDMLPQQNNGQLMIECCRRNDNTTFIAELNVKQDTNGKLQYGMLRDITEQNLAQKKFIHIKKQFSGMADGDTNQKFIEWEKLPDRLLFCDRKTGKKLPESELHPERIIDSINGCVYATDSNHRFKFVNRYFSELTGIPKDELIGKPVSILADKGIFIEKIERDYGFYMDKNPKMNGKEIYRLGNEERIFLTDKTLIFGQNSEDSIVLTISFDITFIVSILIKENELKKKNQAIKRSQKEFLAHFSHEIRTPLNAIFGFIQLVELHVSKDHQLRHYFDQINKAGKNLMKLINNVLDLSKMEAGETALRKQPVEIIVLLNEIVQLFKPKAEEKDVVLNFNIDSEVPEVVMLDEVRIRQIFTNLISNAVKFTLSGSVSVYLSAKNVTEKLSVLQFEVHDTGIGIPEHEQASVFESFKQQKQQKNTYGGTGLGLAITKRLINLMQGAISLESKVNEGTKFTVQIPHVEIVKEPKKKQSFTSHHSVIFKKPQVLIAETVDSNRILIETLLLDHNVRVISVTNGEEAIEKAIEHKPDLILMSILLEGIDGIEATKIIKGNKRTSHIPIVAITSVTFSESVNQIKNIADNFIQKPVNIECLINTLCDYLPHVVINENEENEEKQNDVVSELCSLKKTGKITSDFLSEMQHEIIPLTKHFEVAIELDIIKVFARKVTDVAKKYRITPLLQFGEDLCRQIENLNITKIDQAVQEFQKIEAVLTIR